MRAVIFANGVMSSWPLHLALDRARDLVIAADGGLSLCRRWGISPQAVIGDLDSVDPAALGRLERQGVAVIRHPARKDHTDLELALRHACRQGAGEIVVLGALGRRWDMTLANVMLLAAQFLEGKAVRLLDGRDTLLLLKGGRSLELRGGPGDGLSLIALSAAVSGITLSGLEYPLRDAALLRGATRGVSNVFQSAVARLECKAGLLLVVHTRQGNPRTAAWV